MINFPIFESLKIENYGLYPGQGNNTLNVTFKPGTTLVLGTNGIGKTTLITILYRMLTGPYELRQASLGNSLGGASLDPRKLSPRETATFSDRVYDSANHSVATFVISIGTSRVTIQRKLKDLSLQKFTIEEGHSSDEMFFQKNVTKLAGVWSFGDWLLMLHNLVFYFEDRRALVWDPSAQREILRFLFLTSDQAETWYKSEREISKLDSQVRNDNSVFNRLRGSLVFEEKKKVGSENEKAELESLEAIQEEEENNLAEMVEISSDLDSKRHNLRHDFMLIEQDRENIARELERAKLIAIKNQFPQKNEIAQYLLAQLIVDGKCLACNSTKSDSISHYSARLNEGKCIICGFAINSQKEVVSSTEFSAERIEKLYNGLSLAENRLKSLEHDLNQTNLEYSQNAHAINDLRIKCDIRCERIDDLIKRLPQDDMKLRKKRQDLTALQETVNENKIRVKMMGEVFEAFVKSVVAGIQDRSTEVKKTFHEYAHGFLLEECILKWSPKIGKVGELGVRIEFPAFDLDMSGVDFPTPSRRRGPEQVSESQREFIDLAFRMALIHVASEGRGGSLVIDAPESSLDGVFVERAAEVLTRFGASNLPNRLVIASNVVQGELIPAILKRACPPAEASERLINLIKLATPTAALREKHSEYQALLINLLRRGGVSDES